MRTSWQRLFGLVLLIKAAYLGLVCVTLWLWPDMDYTKFYELEMRWPRSGDPVFASHFATWDGAHYLYLSEVGYGPGIRSCAFYPLWPLLIRWFAVFTGGSHVIAGMVLANLLSTVAWVVFHRITAFRFGEPAANWALVWLMVFPGSLFYQFIYSEPVFFLLVMGLWYGLERRDYTMAWVSAFLLPLARGVGVFCVLPIGWHLLVRRWGWMQRGQRQAALTMTSATPTGNGTRSDQLTQIDSGGIANNDSFVTAPERVRTTVRSTESDVTAESESLPYGLLLAPMLGWGVYLCLMWGWTGNPFEGIEAQKYWGVHSIGNLWNVPKFVIGWFTPTTWHEFRGSVLDRLTFLILAYTLPVIWRQGKDLVVWTYVLGILPAMSGTFTSYTRFASVAFPIFIALALFFERRRLPWLKWGLFATFAILHVVLLWRFVNFRWAG